MSVLRPNSLDTLEERCSQVDVARENIAHTLGQYMVRAAVIEHAEEILGNAYWLSMTAVSRNRPSQQVRYDHAHSILQARLAAPRAEANIPVCIGWYEPYGAMLPPTYLLGHEPGTLERLDDIIAHPIVKSEVKYRPSEV